MRKKMSLFLVMIMLFSVTISPFGFGMTVNARAIATETQITTLFEEMTETRALALLANDDFELQAYEEKIEGIEQQLSSLGVEELSFNEVNEFLGNTNSTETRMQVTLPEDSDTVKWYLSTGTNHSYNSKYYDIKKLIAVGYNPGGMLVTGADNVAFYSNTEKLANAVSTAVSIYAQKLIGSIPIIQWTPYELLFSNTASNAFNSNYVTHRCVSSISFAYVKEAGQSDDQYYLSHFSNSLSIAVSTHGAAVVNSVPMTYSDHKTATVSADSYGYALPAIQAYCSSGYVCDYIEYYEIFSYGGQYSRRAYVPTPRSGPGQIY